MIASPTLLVVALLCAAGGVLLLERVIRSTAVGFGLVAVAVVVDTLLFAFDVRVALGPFTVYPNDVVYGLLGLAAVARLLRTQRVHPLQVLVLVLLAVSVWSTVRGIPIHGPGAAINEARKNLTYGSAVLYFSTMPLLAGRADRFVRWWVRLGAYLLAVAVLRWVAFFAGVPALLAQGDTLRVLDSFDTVVILTGLLLAAGPLLRDRSGSQRPGPRTRVPPALEVFVVGSFLAVVLLQHRTLWIALVVGVVLLTARDPRVTGRLLAATVVAGVVVSVAAIAVFGQGVETVVSEELGSSATDVDTFEWRLEGWSRLVETSLPETPDEVLFGQPFGKGFDRYLRGQLITVTPHNYFLESYLRVGVIGMGALVLLHVLVIARLYPTARRTGMLRDDAVAVALVALLLYYLTSHPDPEHGALTGFAVALAMRAGGRRTRHGDTTPTLARPRSEVPA